MALYYKYIYQFKDSEIIIYSGSRTEADDQFKKMFKVDIIRFLRREPW